MDYGEIDIVGDVYLRGNNPPSGARELPYFMGGTIKNYTYSSYYFKPSLIGKFHTSFSGTCINGTNVKVKITLYNKAGDYQTEYTLSSASRFSQGISWFNLNRSTYYYFKVELLDKANYDEELSFTMNITEQND